MEGSGWLEPNLSDQTVLPHHVNLALTYMSGNLAEKITLSDVVRACATSERTLLKQFQKCVGLSPLAYLRRQRLNMARRELLKTARDEAISDVAIRCGYPHLGRFAGDYRRLFGESPSTTRQRVRSRAAYSAFAGDGAADSRSPVTAAWRERPSLLILPLRTETLKEGLEARDLTDRLAAALSCMQVASVRLAHPSQPIQMTTARPRNAGSEYCLQGRLTQREERTRVIVSLVDVAADRHLWGDSFDGSVHDPFELQDRIADGVLCATVSQITDAEIERVHSMDPNDRGRRDLALQALRLVLGASVPTARSAMAILDRALELDPADATSMALLACCHAQLSTYHGTPSPVAARDAALELARRAAVLDNINPLVTTARGAAATLALQPDAADALVVRALAMDPTSAWAWERRGFLRLNSPADADRAITDFRRALQLRGPRISRANCFVGIAAAHQLAGRIEETDLWTRKAIAENPGASWLHRWQSCYLAKTGDRPKIRAAVEQWRRAQPHMTVSLMLACFPPADPGWLDELARAGLPL